MERDKNNAGSEKGNNPCGSRFGNCGMGIFCKTFFASILALIVFTKCCMMMCCGGMMKHKMMAHSMMAKKVHPYNQCIAISLINLSQGQDRKSKPTKDELVDRLKIADANCAKLANK